MCKSLSHVLLFGHALLFADRSPCNSPGQNTGVDSLSLFQGIFPTQGSNPGLQHCRQILYQLSYQGSPIPLSGCGTICLFIHILDKDILVAPKLCEFLLIQKILTDLGKEHDL